MNILTIGDGKNHSFGKVVNEHDIEFAPAALVIGDKQYIGNDETKYRNAGYLPINYTDEPEGNGTGYYEAWYLRLSVVLDITTMEEVEYIQQSWHWIYTDHIDTTTIKDWSYYCYEGARVETLKNIKTYNGENFNRMCFKATGFYELELNCEKATDLQYAFYQCSDLRDLTLHLPSIETGSETGNASISSIKLASAFRYASALTNLTITGRIQVQSDDLNFAYCSNLTAESLLNILNALVGDSATQHTVYLGNINIGKLTTEQQQIATNKNIALG